MKRMENRLAAFTVIEMMVALALTALAIALIFSAFRLIEGQRAALADQFSSSAEIDRLYRSLQTDTRRATAIRRSSNGLGFQSTGVSIHYLLSDSLCIRQVNQLPDTFRVQVDSVAYWFLRKRQQQEMGAVDECGIYLSTSTGSSPLLIHKTYDMATLMQLTDSIDRYE